MISSTLTTALLWTAAISSGLMAGIYFAFSGFIMKSFGNIPTQYSVTAMNAINETIIRSWFMPLFFGSSIISVLLVFVAITNWDETGAGLKLIAGMVYIVGMFVCTAVFNVPLNQSLAKLDPVSGNAKLVWSEYLRKWTTWNHLRTVSSLVTCVLCIWLLTYKL